jgi:uncharacterized protein YndB with AHSA1/START domain
MPKQKDLKRLVRTRMQKTGEAYTAARAQVVARNAARNQAETRIAAVSAVQKQTSADYAASAGLSDASVSKATGRAWAQWVDLLDRARAAEKPHREIARFVSSLGTPSWWTQMVTVGYERIRGLRERGQSRSGAHAASKSRTFPVPVETLFEAFANARKRRRWLPVKIAVRSITARKRMRLTWEDDTIAVLEFSARGRAKSTVAVGHLKLRDKSAADAMKKTWSEHFDRLGEFLS